MTDTTRQRAAGRRFHRLHDCLLAGIVCLSACSSTGAGGQGAGGTQVAIGATGGASSAGGASGGTPSAGGAPAFPSSGGASSVGGVASTGGVLSSGGRSATGGGTSTIGISRTGGATATGGTTFTGGTTSTGGSNSTSGSTVDGGVAPDYVARKWARWPIPNPPSMSLPHPMSYTVGTDGITDTITGLVWQKSTNTATTTWADAIAYCQSLGTGWSLPTRIELTSILDNTLSRAKVNSQFTFGKSAGWVWASTPWVVNERKSLTGASALSWFINFSAGDSNNSLSQTAASAYSRCVKIPTTQALPASHYTIANGEVTDNYTGLIWQQGDSGATPSNTWDQAAAYCTELALNGQTWRLPSLNELASIVDDVPTGNVSPAVDHTAFPTTSSNQIYWSASSYGTGTAERWTLNFMDGFTSHKVIATLAIVRCVR